MDQSSARGVLGELEREAARMAGLLGRCGGEGLSKAIRRAF